MYASSRFLEMSGYDAAGCMGKPHSEIFRGMGAGSSAVLLELGHGGTTGMQRGEIEGALACLSSAADSEYEAMASDRAHMGYYVTLGRDRAGGISVSEVLFFFPRHRTMGWTYGFGVRRDITREIPVDALLNAASSGGYAELVDGHAKAAKQGALPWFSAGDQVVRHFETKAVLAWRARVGGSVGQLGGASPKQQPRRRGSAATTESTRTPDDASDAEYEELYAELASAAGVLTREYFDRDHVTSIRASTAEPAKNPRGPAEEQEMGARHGAKSTRPSVPCGTPGSGADFDELYEELAATAGTLSVDLFTRDHVPALLCLRGSHCASWGNVR